MALSEREQRLLEEMERSLYQSEADVMQTGSGARKLNYRSLVLGILVTLVGLGVVVGGVASQMLWLGLIGFVVMIGGVLLMFRRTGAPGDGEPAGTPKGGTTRPAPSSESLSERMERRWDERMEGER